MYISLLTRAINEQYSSTAFINLC